MDSKLTKNTSNDVKVEDVRLRPFLGKFLNRLLKLPVSIHTLLHIYLGLTLALLRLKKHTLINIPLIVTWPSPYLMPSKYNTLSE